MLGKLLDLPPEAGPGSFFGGKLDETRIYNRALSPKEIRDLYNWVRWDRLDIGILRREREQMYKINQVMEIREHGEDRHKSLDER